MKGTTAALTYLILLLALIWLGLWFYLNFEKPIYFAFVLSAFSILTCSVFILAFLIE